MKNFLKTNWVLLLIIAITLLFRFWQIHTLPGGLFPDEAANGLDVNSMLHGHLQPFYERGNGREALFFYFEALSVLIFGRGVWQFHIVSAAFGVGSVIAVYFLAKRMFSKRVALLSSFFLSVSSYAILVTRSAFRATTVPFFTTMTVLFLVKFFSAGGGSAFGEQETDRRKKYWAAAWSGIFFAAGFYTYTSFRMMLPLVVGFLLLMYLAYRHKTREVIRQYWKYKAVFALCFLLAISWLAIYFIHHPGSFVGRAGEVSIFSKDLNHGDAIGTFVDVVKKTALSFFTQGDLNWRQNVSGFPFLPFFLSPLFAVALTIFSISFLKLLRDVLKKRLNEKTLTQGFVAIWFWFMLIPEITTAEGIPHGLRLIGVIPPVFILCGWMADKVWNKLAPLIKINYVRIAVPAIFLLSLFIYGFYAYFVIAATSPDYYYAFRSDLTAVSDYLNARNKTAQTYLALDEFSVQTVQYLTTEKQQPYVLLDPASTYKVHLKKGDQVIFTESSFPDRIKFERTHPKVQLIEQEKNQFSQPIMLVYQEY